jgi:SPP1 gp7 family putative phage head morphogenesis protein
MAMLQQLVSNRRAFAKSFGEKYKVKRMPRMQHPIAFEVDFAKYLKQMAEAAKKQIDEKLVTRLPFIVRSASVSRGDERADAYTDDLNEIFRTIKATLGNQFTEEQIRHAIKSKGLNIANWNRKQMTAALSSALSVDIFMAEPYLNAELIGFVNRNVNLIETRPQTYLKNVEQTVAQGIRSGMRVEQLKGVIDDKFKPAMNHAELIARDQVGKFNGDLNHLRQKELGIRKYIWRTVRDERVRPYHADLEGTVQSWDEPPVVSRDGRREHPGGDFQCRCQAEPVLDF